MSKHIILISAIFLSGCATVSPYQSQLDNYKSYLESEVYANRLTLNEANKLLMQKQNELTQLQIAESQRMSAVVGAFGSGLQQSQYQQEQFETQKMQAVSNILGGHKTYRITQNAWGSFDARET